VAFCATIINGWNRSCGAPHFQNQDPLSGTYDGFLTQKENDYGGSVTVSERKRATTHWYLEACRGPSGSRFGGEFSPNSVLTNKSRASLYNNWLSPITSMVRAAGRFQRTAASRATSALDDEWFITTTTVSLQRSFGYNQ